MISTFLPELAERMVGSASYLPVGAPAECAHCGGDMADSGMVLATVKFPVTLCRGCFRELLEIVDSLPD